MKMTLLPPRMEKWLINKFMPVLIQRISKSGAGGRFTQNGKWIVQSDKEAETAFAAVGKEPWMYAAAYAIASSGSMLPFGVYKKAVSTKGGDYTLDESNKLSVLVAKPNPYQTGEEFKEACFWSLELSGKLFIEVFPNKQNPQELYVLDPRCMTPKKDAKTYVSGYEYDLDGQKIPYTPDEIIFHRYYNPADPYDGLPGCTPAGDAINSNINSTNYNNAFFENSGVPYGTLTTEKRLNDAEADQIALSWSKSHKGGKKAHKTAVLYGGLEFKVIQRTPKEMEFVKQKSLNREETLAAYGVPPVMVGLLESVNYGNSKEQKKLFWQQTMRPKLIGLAKRMTMEFGLDGTKLKFMFDLSAVDALQEDEEIKSRIAFNLSKSGFSWDEIRKRIYNLPPLPDEVGKWPWVPVNMVPAKLQMNGPAQAKPTTGKPGKPDGPSENPGPENQKPEAGKTFTQEEVDDMLDSVAKYLSDTNEINKEILVG